MSAKGVGSIGGITPGRGKGGNSLEVGPPPCPTGIDISDGNPLRFITAALRFTAR